MPTLKSFKQVREVGGVVSKVPLKRHIAWKAFDPATEQEVEYDVDVFMLRPSAGTMLELHSDAAADKRFICTVLSKVVMWENEKGKFDLMSIEDAYQLDPPLLMALWDEWQLVSGAARKNSPPSTSSGASSSQTESVAAA